MKRKGPHCGPLLFDLLPFVPSDDWNPMFSTGAPSRFSWRSLVGTPYEGYDEEQTAEDLHHAQ
jgi:hypothetical protein